MPESKKKLRAPKTKKSRAAVSRKISLLVKEEGIPQEQAVARAHSLFRRGELR